MLRIRLSYLNDKEKEDLLQELQGRFKILNIKEGKKKGPYRKIYIDLKK